MEYFASLQYSDPYWSGSVTAIAQVWQVKIGLSFDLKAVLIGKWVCIGHLNLGRN